MAAYRYFKLIISSGWDASLCAMTSIHICDEAGSKYNTEGMTHSTEHTLNGDAYNCSDANTGNYWQFNLSDCPNAWKVDLGAGNAQECKHLRLTPLPGYGRNAKAFELLGSNDDSAWNSLLTDQTSSSADGDYIFDVVAKIYSGAVAGGAAAVTFVPSLQITQYLPNFLPGGTASSDGDWSTNTPDKAIDSLTTTLWESNSGLPCWWQVDLGAGITKTPRMLQIGMFQSGGDEGPKTFTLKASNTGVFGGEETTLLIVTNAPNWVNKELRQWAFSNDTAFRYFRVTISSTQSGSYAQMCEIRLCEEDPDQMAFGTDVLAGGASSANADSNLAYRACDDDSATVYAGGGVPSWWQYDFGEGNAKKIRNLTVFSANSLDQERSIKTFTLNGSNTGSFSGEETVLLSVTDCEPWFIEEKKSWKFENTESFRYYRIKATALYAVYTYLCEIEMMEELTPGIDDGISSGGIVFGGQVIEIGTRNATDPAASGGIVFGSTGDISTPENNQTEGVNSGGITFGSECAEQWQNVQNDQVAVKGGTYRISGVIYTLANTMSYSGLGDIAALVPLGSPPAVAGTFRYDLLSVNAAGAIAVTAGAETATPVMPATPASSIKLDHVLRYYGQTSVVQADIGKLYLAPVLTTLTVTITDDELGWAEASTAIAVVCKDQYGQLYTGSKVVNATFLSGNGTIAPLSVSGNASSLSFTYTRDIAVTDVSPVIQFTSPTGPTAIAQITLLDAAGDPMY